MATLYHQIWIDAPTARVYEAISTADGLGKWWVPHTSTETDEGFVLSHSPGGEHFAWGVTLLMKQWCESQ